MWPRTVTTAFLPFVLCLTAAAAEAADPVIATSPRLTELAKAAATSSDVGQRAVNGFWAERTKAGTPLIEPAETPDMMLVSFVARSPADRLANLSLMMLRTTEPVVPMRQVPGTDVWSVTLKMPRTSRSLYMFAWPQGRTPDPAAALVMPTREHGVQEVFADPLAARRATGSIRLGVTEPLDSISWFQGGDAPAEPYLRSVVASARGTLADRLVASKAMGGERRVTIYSPAGGKPADGRLLILFDAEQYIDLMSTPTILDAMIADKVIPPITVAFVHAGKTRMGDLTPNASYQAFLRDELLPLLRRDQGISADPARIAIGGFSHGGLAAASAALADPQVYGNVISQSASYWWSPDLRPPLDPKNPMPLEAGAVAAKLAATPLVARNVRFYLDVGTWEGLWQISSNRQVRDLLKLRGNALTYAEFEGGHDYIAWRSTLPDALIAIFGGGERR